MQDQTFHQCISKVLLISQIFGLLPVSNILAKHVEQLRYSWFSLVTIYVTLIFTLNMLEFVTVVNLVFKYGINFHTSGTVSLFVVCLLEHVYFWRLATKWPLIMKLWRQAEEIFLRMPYRLYATYNIKRRIYGLTFLVMFSAFVEHCLLLYNSHHKSDLERSQCKLNISILESLYRRERYHMQFMVPYRLWLLPILEWINLSLAYARSFTDAFIICVSIGLTARFRQIYHRIKAVHTKALPELFWIEVRQHYLAMKKVMRLLNTEIAPIIVLAGCNNMYFICFQIFNSTQNIGVDFVAVLAFVYSLTFAIARAGLTLFVASTVHDYSRKILQVLRDVPTRSWCFETQRFSEQLNIDLTALSGNGFFFLTRRLILAMVSTIVTYELMLTGVINKGSIKQITDYCRSYGVEVIQTGNETMA